MNRHIFPLAHQSPLSLMIITGDNHEPLMTITRQGGLKVEPHLAHDSTAATAAIPAERDPLLSPHLSALEDVPVQDGLEQLLAARRELDLVVLQSILGELLEPNLTIDDLEANACGIAAVAF